MFPSIWDDTEYWLIPKIARATLYNRRDMSTLGFAWIPEFTGARDVLYFWCAMQRDCLAGIILSSAKECLGTPRAKACEK